MIQITTIPLQQNNVKRTNRDITYAHIQKDLTRKKSTAKMINDLREQEPAKILLQFTDHPADSRHTHDFDMDIAPLQNHIRTMGCKPSY
jgi:hypothetical protein